MIEKELEETKGKKMIEKELEKTMEEKEWDKDSLREKLIKTCKRNNFEVFEYLINLAEIVYKKDFVEKIEHEIERKVFNDSTKKSTFDDANSLFQFKIYSTEKITYNLLQLVCEFNFKDDRFKIIEYLLKNFNFDANSCLDITDLNCTETIQILFETGKLNSDIQDRFYKRVIDQAITYNNIELLKAATQKDYKRTIALLESKKPQTPQTPQTPKISFIKRFMNFGTDNLFAVLCTCLLACSGLAIIQQLLNVLSK